MATTTNINFDTATCQDIIGFQEYLKRLRTVDDTIILNLNDVLSTKQSDEKNKSNCSRFHNQLQEAYDSRNRLINVCLGDANAKVSELSDAKKQNNSDISLIKEHKRHQTRLRMIQKELTVEQIIQDRSLKALQERCRRYLNF